jgi:four helix bundle protein
MTPQELKARTSEFARVAVVFCVPLLEKAQTRELADQLLRSGTGMDSNYGSAQVARSPDEFVARMGQVLDDANESLGWVKLFVSSKLTNGEHLPWLQKEADELARIFAKSYQTARANNERRKAQEKAAKRIKKPGSPRSDRR